MPQTPPSSSGPLLTATGTPGNLSPDEFVLAKAAFAQKAAQDAIIQGNVQDAIDFAKQAQALRNMTSGLARLRPLTPRQRRAGPAAGTVAPPLRQPLTPAPTRGLLGGPGSGVDQ